MFQEVVEKTIFFHLGVYRVNMGLPWECIYAHSSGGHCDKARVGPGLFFVDRLPG